MAKCIFPQLQGENSQFKEQKKSRFCDILTALCHIKLYVLICEPKNWFFALFDTLYIYNVSFS